MGDLPGVSASRENEDTGTVAVINDNKKLVPKQGDKLEMELRQF
jgi:hypothetical protein